MIYNPSFDTFPPTDEVYGANTETYWCDYNWTNSSTSDRTLLIGGSSGGSTYCGFLDLGSDYGLGDAGADVGTRIIYVP